MATSTAMAGAPDNAAAGRGGPLSPLSILILVTALQLLERFFDGFNKRGLRIDEQAELRQEIKDLLKEASSLSTPSTFAQAAKLRRLAAAKEKELVRKQEEHGKDKKLSYGLYNRALFVFKVLFYAGLSWLFWGVPVAIVPCHVLQPFGKVLSWRAGDAATGEILVGIIPWLVLTSRVSNYFCQKLPKNRFQI